MKASKSVWFAVLGFAVAVATVGGCTHNFGDETATSSSTDSGYHKAGTAGGDEGGGYHHCSGVECTGDGMGGESGSDTTTSTHTTSSHTTTTTTTTSSTTSIEDECLNHASCEHESVNDVCSTNPGGCTDILTCDSNHEWKLLEADVDCGSGGSGGGSTGSTSSSTSSSTTSSSTTTTSSSTSTSTSTSTGPVVETMVVDFIPLDQTVTHTFMVGGVPNGTIVTTFGGGKWVSISFPLQEGHKVDLIYVLVDGAYYSCGGPEPINPVNHFTGIVRASWGGVAVEPRMVGNGGSGCNIGVTASDAGWSHAGSCDQLDSAKYLTQLETVGDSVDYNCNGNVDL